MSKQADRYIHTSAEELHHETIREIVFGITHPGEPAAGVHAYTDEVTVRIDSGDPGGEDGEFVEYMREALAILERYQGYHPKYVRRQLKAAGYRRSVNAIIVKRKRTRLTGPADGCYTAGQLAGLLGVDNSTTALWCRQGLLRAKRRGTDRVHLPDDWLISDAAVRQFIIDYPAHLDLRKIEQAHSKFWLIDLLTGQTGVKAPGGRKQHD